MPLARDALRTVKTIFPVCTTLFLGWQDMNLDQLILKDRKRAMAYFLIGISLLLIFVLGGQQFTDFRDPKVFWPLFFESIFLLGTSFVFRFFYKIDATFLIFVLGVPVGIFFTQISLLVIPLLPSINILIQLNLFCIYLLVFHFFV